MPDGVGVARHAVEFVDEIERALRVGRSLHVDTHKPRRIHGRGFGDQPADDVAGQLLIHIEPHVREFKADIGVEVVGGNSIKNLMIELGAVAGLVGIRDIFA